ncbi:biliverdin-producing heme oxygenase [Prosthecobacter sp.]|uniref:biliverdin-producing heme oxygenase n=1 Tax=Prosthecobacter sp. TaxID=1965333 RepID=UPI00378442C7
MTHDSSETLSHLRTATADAHRQLEDQIDIPRTCAAPGTYVRLLEGFLGFFEPLESALQKFDGWDERGFHWRDRAKTPMLREDLHAFGLSESDLASLPRCTDLPDPTNLAEAFGCAYVLEGSTLGGRHIMGALAQSQIPQAARHYFASYGEQVPARWREFCGMLATFPTSDSDAMTDVAVNTFHKLGAWLTVAHE